MRIGAIFQMRSSSINADQASDCVAKPVSWNIRATPRRHVTHNERKLGLALLCAVTDHQEVTGPVLLFCCFAVLLFERNINLLGDLRVLLRPITNKMEQL